MQLQDCDGPTPVSGSGSGSGVTPGMEQLLPPVFDHLLYAKMEEQLRPGRFSHMRNVR